MNHLNPPILVMPDHPPLCDTSVITLDLNIVQRVNTLEQRTNIGLEVMMEKLVKTFTEISAQERKQAGGKGGTLARLYQAGYPVPDGFVILPAAFYDDELSPHAWQQVVANLQEMRRSNGATAFAVRSSALSEDSAFASFAGEFETVLDVHTDEAVRGAIKHVYHSRETERVKAYSQAKGLDETHEIAVVVQQLVRAEISGILFTADPVMGNRFTMTGNYVYGFGEELVSGEVEPYTFTVQRPKGKYNGPKDMKRYAKQLYRLACRLEVELNGPQDIEWAIADGRLYLLQSRPITTLVEFDPTTGEYNSSHTGDYVWVGSEVFRDVITLSTFSAFSHFHNFKIEGMQGTGNIGGRLYMNYSFMASFSRAFGVDVDTYVEMAIGINVRPVTSPPIPLSRWQLIKYLLPIQLQILPQQFKLMKKFDEIINENPQLCTALHECIAEVSTTGKLADLWDSDIYPHFYNLLMVQDKSNEDYFNPYIAARKKMIELIGQDQAEILLAKLVGGSGNITSLGSLIGLQKLAAGELSRADYTKFVGHRPNREDELSIPRPYEDPQWIDKHLAEYNADPVDYEAMVSQRAEDYAAAWHDFADRFPKQAPQILKRLDKATAAMEKREIIRSELTRYLGVIRAWYLKAGQLTGIGEGIFHLRDAEVLEVLAGDRSVVEYIPARKETFRRLCLLPPYPPVISGRFDPFRWAEDPQRRNDYFDSHADLHIEDNPNTITGLPGSAGRVEGMVRIIHSPEESDQFNRGEILVASSTNVGWTPLFPRAAAVITDVGAPLSHAAIVARELGIPAVVGARNATMLLQTGDRVIVDGGLGTVQILNGSH